MAKHGVGPEVFPSQCLLFKNGRTKQYFERISELHLYSRYFGVIPTLVTSQEWREEPGNRHFVTTFAKRQIVLKCLHTCPRGSKQIIGFAYVHLSFTFAVFGFVRRSFFGDCSLVSKTPSSITERFHAPFPSSLIVFHSFCHVFHFVTLGSCADLPADKTRCPCRLVSSYMWECNENYT